MPLLYKKILNILLIGCIVQSSLQAAETNVESILQTLEGFSARTCSETSASSESYESYRTSLMNGAKSFGQYCLLDQRKFLKKAIEICFFHKGVKAPLDNDTGGYLGSVFEHAANAVEAHTLPCIVGDICLQRPLVCAWTLNVLFGESFFDKRIARQHKQDCFQCVVDIFVEHNQKRRMLADSFKLVEPYKTEEGVCTLLQQNVMKVMLRSAWLQKLLTEQRIMDGGLIKCLVEDAAGAQYSDEIHNALSLLQEPLGWNTLSCFQLFLSQFVFQLLEKLKVQRRGEKLALDLQNSQHLQHYKLIMFCTRALQQTFIEYNTEASMMLFLDRFRLFYDLQTFIEYHTEVSMMLLLDRFRLRYDPREEFNFFIMNCTITTRAHMETVYAFFSEDTDLSENTLRQRVWGLCQVVATSCDPFQCILGTRTLRAIYQKLKNRVDCGHMENDDYLVLVNHINKCIQERFAAEFFKERKNLQIQVVVACFMQSELRNMSMGFSQVQDLAELQTLSQKPVSLESCGRILEIVDRLNPGNEAAANATVALGCMRRISVPTEVMREFMRGRSSGVHRDQGHPTASHQSLVPARSERNTQGALVLATGTVAAPTASTVDQTQYLQEFLALSDVDFESQKKQKGSVVHRTLKTWKRHKHLQIEFPITNTMLEQAWAALPYCYKNAENKKQFLQHLLDERERAFPLYCCKLYVASKHLDSKYKNRAMLLHADRWKLSLDIQGGHVTYQGLLPLPLLTVAGGLGDFDLTSLQQHGMALKRIIALEQVKITDAYEQHIQQLQRKLEERQATYRHFLNDWEHAVDFFLKPYFPTETFDGRSLLHAHCNDHPCSIAGPLGVFLQKAWFPEAKDWIENAAP